MNKYKKAFDAFEDRILPVHYYPTKNDWKNIDIVNEACDKAAKYDEKETPKKPTKEVNEHNDYDYICPNCDRHFEIDYDEHFKYCPNCGQKLDKEE